MSEKIAAIKRLEDKYGIVLFSMALTHLVDVGARHLTDVNYDDLKRQISECDGYSILSPEFLIEIVRCAEELARFDIWDLFRYIKYYLQITEE